jgi:hypothetical protein
LFPESTGTLSLSIEPPPTCPAGEYLVVLRVLSTIESTRQVAHDFWLSVEASPAATMQLVPSVVTGGKKARFLVRQSDGDSFSDFDNHFRRAFGRASFANPPTLADAMCWFPVHALVSL